MIAGFVSETRSRTRTPCRAAGRHATAVRATTLHQRRLAAAGCAPSAHGENCVSGFAAPIATCRTKIAAVAIARGPSPGASRRCRHAATHAPITTTPTAAATYRWAIAIAGTPMYHCPSSVPHKGQSRQAIVAPAPRTYAPLSMSTKVPIAPASASHVHPPLGARAAFGQLTTTARTVSVARSSSAFARCSVTHSGGSSSTTVTAPKTACSGYNVATATASHNARRSARYERSVQSTIPATASPDAIARKRCVHSMRVAGSSDGRNCPWQSGQSGHPSPEPVTRTTPPHTTTRNDATKLAYTSAR